MSNHTIQIVHRPHVAAWYHVLSNFNLPGDALSCHNPAYWNVIATHRPTDLPPPSARLGAFHQRYRKGELRSAIQVLPLAFDAAHEFKAVLKSLMNYEPAPEALSPMARRVLQPLAKEAGVDLITLMMSLVSTERSTFLDQYYSDQTVAMTNAIGGTAGFIKQHLPPLLNTLFPETQQTVIIFLCAALAGQARSVQPARHTHHIATFPQPNIQHALFHTLTEVARRKSDRLIRHYFPSEVANEPHGLIANQMRFDAAITTSYHLLLRQDAAQIEAFKTWARTQFRHTPRKPEAAVAALHDFFLVPEDAEEAIRALVGDSEHS